MRSAEDKRAVYLPAAKLLFIAAHMQAFLASSEAETSQQLEQRAYQAARRISDMYENLYSEEDRYYHSLQHPRVQLLDSDGLQKLAEIYNADQTSLTEEAYITDLAKQLPASMAQTLRDQDRHDCIYYFPFSTSRQHGWLHRLKTGSLTIPQIIEESRLQIANDHPFHFAEMVPFSHDMLSVGELAAIALFPDYQGGYDHTKTFAGQGGVNEWVSAVYAITEENSIRTALELPLLDMQETLQICMSLAATYPFQEQDHLDAMASNIYLFLTKEENQALRAALGVEGNAPLLREWIDKSVHKAGTLANRDVSNFSTPDIWDLYHGDRAVTAENLGINPAIGNPVQHYKFSYLILDQHAEEEVRQSLDPAKTGAGYIRHIGNSDRIYHDFKAELSGNILYRINEAIERHRQYRENAENVILMYKRDMAFAGLQIAAALKGDEAVIPRKEQLPPALLEAFFRGTPSAAQIAVNLTRDVETIADIKALKSHQIPVFLEKIKDISLPRSTSFSKL